MANNISPSTGQPYYSGDWEQDIKHLIKSTNVGEGIMNTVNMTEVTKYQEQVDRLIDAQLQALYKTPFKQLKVFNYEVDDFVRIFPGKLVEIATYWTAGLVLKSEFQQQEPSVTEYVQNYMDYAMRMLAEIRAATERMEGQEWRAEISVFMPPNVMPLVRPEPPSTL